MGGVDVIARNIGYKIRVNGEDKEILKDVNVHIPSGNIVGILGQSGSGKTSLANILAGRASSGRIEGCVNFLHDGVGREELEIGSFSHYVMQKDVLMANLTVKETLDYAAALRLRSLSRPERDARVARLVEVLGLQACLNTRIGSSKKKACSGGQIKRVAIAEQLLDEPPLLVLDEPTTGLDSSLAFDVVQCLHDIRTELGTTVVAIVHQPRQQLWAMFDQVLVLSQGQVVYAGPPSDCAPYFAALGHQMPKDENPADFVLDLTTAAPSDPTPEGSPTAAASRTAGATLAGASGEGHVDGPPTAADVEQQRPRRSRRVFLEKEQIDALGTSWMGSKEHADREKRVDALIGNQTLRNYGQRQLLGSVKAAAPGAGWAARVSDRVRQLMWNTGWLTRRSWKNTVRNPWEALIKLASSCAMGLILGGLFWKMTDTIATPGPDQLFNLQNVASALFFPIVGISFGAFDSLASFQNERVLFNRESKADLYTPLAFYVAKSMADMPLSHLSWTLNVVIFHAMVGLRNTWAAWLTYLAIMNLTIFTSMGFFYALSASTPSFEVGQMVGPLFIVIFMTTGGFYVKTDALPSWIAWLRFLSWFNYAYFATVLNEFPPGESTGGIPNDQWLQAGFGIQHLSVARYTLALLGMGLLYRFIAYWILRFFQRKAGVEA